MTRDNLKNVDRNSVARPNAEPRRSAAPSASPAVGRRGRGPARRATFVEHVAPERLSALTTFFTFLDGKLRYDCVACGAVCCRGHGYEVNKQAAGETAAHRRPNLHLFVDPASSAGTTPFLKVHNCPPTCFFLDDAGMCDIQAAHGYLAKPETCRLFPFNNFRLAGDVLVVSPHTSLCPLQLAPFDTHDRGSQHEVLLQDMRHQGLSSRIPVCDPPNGISMSELIGHERAVLAASAPLERERNYETFAATQLDLAHAPGGSIAVHQPPSARSSASVRAHTKFLADVFALALPRLALDDPELTRLITILTPTIRSQLLLVPRTASTAVRSSAAPATMPYVLLGIFLFAAAAKSAGMRKVTVQTVFHLARSYGALLALLGNSSRVMIWRMGVPLPLSVVRDRDLRRRFVGIAKAMLVSRQQRAAMTFGDLVLLHAPDGVHDRMRFVTALMHLVSGRIIGIEEVDDGRTRPWDRAVSTLQRSALALSDERTLLGHLDSSLLRWLFNPRGAQRPVA